MSSPESPQPEGSFGISPGSGSDSDSAHLEGGFSGPANSPSLSPDALVEVPRSVEDSEDTLRGNVGPNFYRPRPPYIGGKISIPGRTK